MILYSIIQLICGLCAIIGLGQAVDKNASKFNIICGYIVCAMFLLFIILIQEAFK